jgi:hypothetical protein
VTGLVTRRRALSLAFVGASAAALFFALPEPEVLAGARKEQVDLIQLRASQDDTGGGSIDPKLADIRALTQRPMTNSYNTFKFLDQKTVPLEQQSGTATLVNGATAAINVLERVGRGRLKLHLELTNPNGNDVTKVDFTTGHRNYFIIGPFPYDNASLFLAVRLKH